MALVHVWKKYVGEGRFEAWCRRHYYEDRDEHTPMARAIKGATCRSCVKAVRDHALWEVADWAPVAQESSRLYSTLVRRARRQVARP